MRPVRLGVLIASTLLAVLFLMPGVALAQAPPPVSFSGPTPFAAGTSPVSVAVGDFNADQDPDLAVANQFSTNVSVLLGGVAGSFTARPTSPPASSPTRWRSATSTATRTPTWRSPTPVTARSRCCSAALAAASPVLPTSSPTASPMWSRWATSTGTGTPTW